jgi:hypothetical protein
VWQRRQEVPGRWVLSDHNARGGHRRPFDGEFCDVPLTLIDGVGGTPVKVVVNISTCAQLRPIPIPPTQIQSSDRLGRGETQVSASAELYYSNFQPTGSVSRWSSRRPSAARELHPHRQRAVFSGEPLRGSR